MAHHFAVFTHRIPSDVKFLEMLKCTDRCDPFKVTATHRHKEPLDETCKPKYYGFRKMCVKDDMKFPR